MELWELNKMDEQTQEKTSKKKGVILFVKILVMLIIVGATVFAIFKITGSKKKAGFPGGFPGGFGGFGGGQAAATSVRTVVTKKDTLVDYVLTNGEIETQTAIEVFPTVAGKVVEMKVSLGSPVKAGDILAYVDPSKPGDYYAKSPVTAPISGSILSASVKPGQTVSANSMIAKIGDVENLQVSAKVPERNIADLAIGQKAEITLQAYGTQKFMARVVRISPVVDAATRTKEVILNFDKKYPQVNAGMFAKVKLYTKEYSGYPAIPQDSFVTVGNEYFLYTVNEDSTVNKIKVERGKNVDGYFQVLSGINPGDVVVTEGMLTLYDGARVKDIAGNVKFEEVPPQPPKGDFDGKPPAGGMPPK